MTIKDELRQARVFKPIIGQGISDIQRFAEDTRHMIVFDVLMNESPVGFQGERIRVFLSDEGYSRAIESEKHGDILITRHYRVCKGELIYTPHKTTEEYEQIRA